jgi:acyl-coenzyme A thioesterase PaaI-like protein
MSAYAHEGMGGRVVGARFSTDVIYRKIPMDLNLARTTLEQGITFVRNAGLQVVELRPGYVKCLMPFRNNGNHIGSMYAGALFTVAEIPGGALFLSSFDTSKYFPIVKALNIDFLKPAKSDVTVEISMTTEHIAGIQAEADSNGKAEFVLKGELKDSAGVVVAESHGVYQIRKIIR